MSYLSNIHRFLSFSQSQLPQVRSLTEIAADLCHSNNSLNSSAPNSISRTNSSVSLTNLSLSTNNSAAHLTADDLESSSTAQRDMQSALKERRRALEEIVKKKTEQLKALCLQEAVSSLIIMASNINNYFIRIEFNRVVAPGDAVESR